MSLISVRNLTMDYGQGEIFKNIDLDIEKGEAIFIIGNSGCGKSTFLRCMNRLVVPTSGEVFVNGVNILDPSADIDLVRRQMGMVYQHFNLFSHLNVLENITMAPMKVLGIPRSDAIKEAKALLERVGMPGREEAMPSELSGGQKQRIAIARTLAMHPEVILFDEPTSALDPTMVEEVVDVIAGLCDEGETAVIVTHDMKFAKTTASRVIFMAEGRIYEQGTPAEIFDSPKKALTMRFLYHSKTFKTELVSSAMDLYSLNSELKRFIGRFKNEERQFRLLSAVCDELLGPVMMSNKDRDVRADVKLMCSDGTTGHTLIVSFPDIESDPLEEPYVDSVSLGILEHYSSVILSRKSKESGYDVCIQM